MTQTLVSARNVSMYPQDWDIVDDADEFDVGTSATLRKIVRQWNEWQPIIAALPRLSRSTTDERAVYVVEPFDGAHKEDTP